MPQSTAPLGCKRLIVSHVGQLNVSATGNEEKTVDLRINFITPVQIPQARLEVGDSRYYGVAEITGFTPATVVSATVRTDIFSTAATRFWAEAAFFAKH